MHCARLASRSNLGENGLQDRPSETVFEDRCSKTSTRPMLILPPHVQRDLSTWITAGYPDETCGLLVGRVENGRVAVERAVQAKNLNRERARDRYDLDPSDWVKADLAARDEGLEIVGIWHSHPDHPPRPSETDLAEALNSGMHGYSYLIVEVEAAGIAGLRSWRLCENRFDEELLQS